MKTNTLESKCESANEKRQLAAACIWIIIPSFNSVVLTRSCLADLARQTYPNIEIVLSDSGSSDGTYQLISKEFPSVAIVRGNPDWWWTKATNEGVKYALRRATAE